MALSPARSRAFDLLQLVESGGYAGELLRARTGDLDARDAGLVHEIVFGVLRYRAQLDFLIGQYSGRKGRLDPEIRTALRMGIYQVRHLDRVPVHAAVDDSVRLVRRARKVSAAGFVNAVLRKADRAAAAWPDRATELSCPEWMLARWERHYGMETACAIARAALEQPVRYTRGERVQDIGSQAIVPLLDLRPGQRFLDLCAAPGNKTGQAAEYGVDVIACDLHHHRLAQVREVTPNLVVLDGTRPLPFVRRFDRILLDAPCSGTGTLARNPEIKWRLKPEDLEDLPKRQAALLAQARGALAPGGLMVYSTCSLEPEENEAIVRSVLPELIGKTLRRIPGRDLGDGFFASVIKSGEPAND